MNKKYLFEKLFLENEEGDRPLLNGDDEINMAALVYSVATKEFEGDDDSDTDSVLSFEERVETARNNLKNVSSLFSRTNRARRRFLRSFPVFKIRRTRTVGQLREIADSIHADRFNSNISKIVGGCTGAAGAAVLIGALAAPVLGPAAVIPMAIAGGVASFSGGGVVFGTAIAEIALVKKKMAAAAEAIDEDRLAFENMEHWFKHTEALMEAIEEVVGFSVMKKLQEDVQEFFGIAKNLKAGKEYNLQFRKLLEGSVKQMCANGAMKAKFGADLAPVIVTFVFVVCLMSPRNRFVFESLVITHRIGLALLGVLDVGVELGRLVAGLVLRGGVAAAEIIPQAAARAFALGAFAGVGMVIDVANVVIASIDLHKGSVSEQAEAVRKAASELEKECDFLEEVYDEISATRQ